MRVFIALVVPALAAIPSKLAAVSSIEEAYQLLTGPSMAEERLMLPEQLRGGNLTLANLKKWTTVHNVTSLRPPPLPPVVRSEMSISHNRSGSGVYEGEIEPDLIYNIAKWAWDIVENNKPSININYDYATAIPRVASWTDLSGWQQTTWGPFWSKWVNGFGQTACELTWHFRWAYNGHIGYWWPVGQYIGQASEDVIHAYASWGFSLTSTDHSDNPLNIGTVSNPIGQITMGAFTTCSSTSAADQYNVFVNLQGHGGGEYPTSSELLV